MLLSELFHGFDIRESAVDATEITADSREVRSGSVFVAVRGTRVDGHEFIADAVARGAVVVVSDRVVDGVTVPVVTVPDAEKALAELAARIQGNPAAALVLCGVTGTNGKSSTAHILRAIVNGSTLGKMGIIGTLGYGVTRLSTATHTTPDAAALHRVLREMKDEQCYGVVMEVSSHAVRQHRVWGLDFRVGILTNVNHDHLDYHSTWEDYRDAKAEFCASVEERGTLVYWNDDAAGRAIGENHRGPKLSVGTAAGDLRVGNVVSRLDGTTFTLHTPSGSHHSVRSRLLGAFVATNSALAAAAAGALGVSEREIVAGLERIDRVPGRFETMGGGDRPTIVIDYAHTADAVESVLKLIRALGARHVFTVFGCGGDRDRGKRPLMGRIAADLCDHCFVTTDNPRSESVERIVDDILRDVGTRSTVTVELDRSRAIDLAVSRANAGDVVALLGKGHETYQIIGDRTLPFSDRLEAEGALSRWSAR